MNKVRLAPWLPVFVFILWGCAATPSPSVSPKATPVSHAPPAQSSRPDSPRPAKPPQTPHPLAQNPGQDPSRPIIIESLNDKPGGSTDERMLPLHGELDSPEELSPKDTTGKTETDKQETKVQPVLDEALDYCQLSQEFWQKGELENALEALDHAYALILRVDTENNPKLIQQKEDLRFTISRRILEIYASRHIVVNGHHNEIPMVMNSHIQKEIKLFTGKEKQFFIDSYHRSGRFREYIVEELRKNGLPEELSWLPLIESGFKVRALSRARALGLWQFISSTGYKFGLKRDMYIDERLDPEKATAAAISYLKELHQIFGEWTTVLAAYNCGEGRVLRVIRSQNINYLDNFWDLYEKLPMETARYVPRFLASLHILNNPEKYGFSNLTLAPVAAYETVTVNRQVHLKHIAQDIGVPETVLKDLNPELRYRVLPKDAYQLRVPTGKKSLVLSKIESIPLSSPPRSAFTYYRVRRGDSLSKIAKRYRTSVRRIKRANNLRSSRIIAGKRLKIPLKGTAITAPPGTLSKPKYPPATHRVKQGDSLWIIARRYGTTTQKIQTLNNLKTTRLHIGQILKIHEPKDSTAPPKYQRRYTVKKGDSPFTIAKKHNISLTTLLKINRLTSKSMIYPGQQLYID